MKNAVIWISAAINSVKKLRKHLEVRTLAIFESRASLSLYTFLSFLFILMLVYVCLKA